VVSNLGLVLAVARKERVVLAIWRSINGEHPPRGVRKVVVHALTKINHVIGAQVGDTCVVELHYFPFPSIFKNSKQVRHCLLNRNELSSQDTSGQNGNSELSSTNREG